MKLMRDRGREIAAIGETSFPEAVSDAVALAVTRHTRKARSKRPHHSGEGRAAGTILILNGHNAEKSATSAVPKAVFAREVRAWIFMIQIGAKELAGVLSCMPCVKDRYAMCEIVHVIVAFKWYVSPLPERA